MADSDDLRALRAHLLAGQVIPAHPLALTEARSLDERHQRALTRYYVAAGSGGIAVGVHTTQFAIRDPEFALLEPVLELASHTVDESLAAAPRPFAKIAGIVGRTREAVREARLAVDRGYHAGLLSLVAWRDVADPQVLVHCRAVAEVIPIFGFYLQPAVGGRVLSYEFWRAFLEIPNVVAIKIAPFDRYRTLDVVRAVTDSRRNDVALYTGNDDHILLDLLTRFPGGRRIVGGLLGQWAMWTRRAVEMLESVRCAKEDEPLDRAWLSGAAAITDANGAIFDARNNFRGCIPGIHEVLRRQGLMRGTWCLEPDEVLSEGQREEIDRVLRAYPRLSDDEFVAERLDDWLR
ncbi:MAG TPA: dihydrodipicolinate synthase family protein [Gemmatimonadaceae bacterium]|jgi:dihydrodipicolinate synthase/N-acetylneuraminate lyase|nr:dihydrodipicolinate synthase family protein [Gemmatimonadaceae bacterium]